MLFSCVYLLGGWRRALSAGDNFLGGSRKDRDGELISRVDVINLETHICMVSDPGAV